MPDFSVLVVDDNDVFKESVFILLENEGIPYESSSNGLEALAIAKKIKPAVVVTDIKFAEGIDGLEVCRRIKKDPELVHAHVMIISGSSDISKAKAAGADSWFPKPFLPKEFRRMILELKEKQL